MKENNEAGQWVSSCFRMVCCKAEDGNVNVLVLVLVLVRMEKLKSLALRHWPLIHCSLII